MTRRLHLYSIGVYVAAAFRAPWMLDVRSQTDDDPHKPRPRSKGEKARNRKLRGSRP